MSPEPCSVCGQHPAAELVGSTLCAKCAGLVPPSAGRRPSDPGPSNTVVARIQLASALRALEELRRAPGWSSPQLRWLDEQQGRLSGMIEVLEQLR